MQVSSRRSLGGSALGPAGPSQDSPVKARSSSQRNKRYSTAFELKSTNSPKTQEEKKQQQAVAEFYQDVVKRVQENKLTAKNAFGSRNIIDNLDVVLQLAKGSFHKASCAVSTAAEVYCLEVDDLCATTSLVQEMLFNSDNKRGEMDGEDARANRKKADGTAGSSSNVASSTLETNLANIRSDQVEAELEVDAQFQKLLQGKDPGAQGMLLNILGVYNGPNLALDCTGIPAFGKIDEQDENAARNVLPPQIELALKTPKFLEFKISKSLLELREELGKRSSQQAAPSSHSVVEMLDPRASFGTANSFDARQSLENPTKPGSVASGTPTAGSSSFHSVSEGGQPVEDYEYEDYMDADDGDDYDDGEPAFPASTESGGSQSEEPYEQPNALPMIMRAFEMQAMGTDSGKIEYFEAPDLLDAIENTNGGELIPQMSISGGKYWLGDLHWKAPKMKAIDGKKQEEALAKRKSSKAKETRIDFFAASVDEKTLFAKPATARTNMLSKASMNKGTFLLPKNMHFTISDLCKLFVRPSSTFKPIMLTLDPSKSSSYSIESSNYQYDGDSGSGGGMYEDGPSGFDDDEDNGFYDCEPMFSPMKNLVAPAHHVERIRVAYATRAKKVDVKKLKYDLWDTIDTLSASQPPIPVGSLDAPIPSDDNAETSVSHEVPELSSNVSLVGSIKSLSPKEQNDAITVPFYFICMLHLANEHGLELLSSPGLDDIAIFKTC